MINHIKQLQQYSVYTNGLTKPIYQPEKTTVFSKTGLLQQEVYTPIVEKPQQYSYYLYGQNYDMLSFDGYTVKRMDQIDDPNNQAETITFEVTNNNKLSEYSLFYYNELIRLMLFSQTIFLK